MAAVLRIDWRKNRVDMSSVDWWEVYYSTSMYYLIRVCVLRHPVM